MTDDEPSSIEVVLSELGRCSSSITIERLRVTHAADDDNLWFIRAGPSVEVQIASRPNGEPPFLIEGDNRTERVETSDVAEAVEQILSWLGID